MTEMTPPAPEKQYIISESEINSIRDLIFHEDELKAIRIFSGIRQHPHPLKDTDPNCKECIGRFDECASSDDCNCIAYCIMAANNARRSKIPDTQRIADVIEKLEADEKSAIARYTDATTKNEEVYQQGIAFAYQRAIALLRESKP